VDSAPAALRVRRPARYIPCPWLTADAAPERIEVVSLQLAVVSEEVEEQIPAFFSSN